MHDCSDISDIGTHTWCCSTGGSIAMIAARAMLHG
jgi:hypothetical protein